MFATVALLAQLAGTLTVGERTEVRARESQGDAHPSADIAFLPSAKLALVEERRWRQELSYVPVLTFPSVETSVSRPEILHRGSLNLGWRERRVDLGLYEDVTYGQMNYTYLNVQPREGGFAPPPTVQPPPTTDTLKIGRSRTQLVASVRLARRWSLTVAPSYALGGGLDSASEAIAPAQALARAEASLDWTATRRAHFISAITVWRSTFASPTLCITTLTSAPAQPGTGEGPAPVCSPRDEVVEGWEKLTERLSPATDVSLGVGAAITRTRPSANDAWHSRAFPAASASLLHRASRGDDERLEIAFDARLAPVLDVRFGTLDQRAQLNGRLTDGWGRTTLNLTLSATQSLPTGDPGAATYVGGGVEWAVRLNRNVDASAGARGAWSRQRPFDTFLTASMLLAITVHESLHF